MEQFDEELGYEMETQKSPEGNKRSIIFLVASIVFALVGVACVVVAVTPFVLPQNSTSPQSQATHNSDNKSSHHYPADTTKRLSFTLEDPIVVPPGETTEKLYWDVQQPELLDSFIRQVSFEIQDLQGNNVPLERIYNHHVFLDICPEDFDPETRHDFDQVCKIVSAIGAEGERSLALDLPDGFGVYIPSNYKFVMQAVMVNIWGLASHAPMEVVVKVNVIYSKKDWVAEELRPVQGALIGRGVSDTQRVAFNIEKGDGTSSVSQFTADTEWNRGDAVLVQIQGHVHIGGVKQEMVDKESNQIIATSTPTYDAAKYIVRLERSYPLVKVHNGQALRINSYYDNSLSYGEVMSIMLVYYAEEK